MKRGQQILVTVLWATLVLAMVGVVVGQFFHHPRGPELQRFFPAPSFHLTDQRNEPISNTTLAGSPYIAAFIFTSCQQICPAMTSQMATLQHQLPASVKLVSFSVDPDHDTPAVLEAYGKVYGADDNRWFFLTGPSKDIYNVAKGMNLTAIPATGLSPIMHSAKLLLIDGSGEVRGIYDSTDPDDLKKLVTDATRLSSES
jgi:protein SCO1/2